MVLASARSPRLHVESKAARDHRPPARGARRRATPDGGRQLPRRARATGSAWSGRNGAGKTTLTRILAGEGLPASGKVTLGDSVGYLPQDPRTGDLEVLARDRILAARGLDSVVRRLRDAEEKMGSDDPAIADKAMRRWSTADAELHANGGYAAESEAARIAASLGIADRLLGQPLRTLSGGQRRRVELARILFSDAEIMLLDEPTNHLDADSVVWLREFLRSFRAVWS